MERSTQTPLLVHPLEKILRGATTFFFPKNDRDQLLRYFSDSTEYLTGTTVANLNCIPFNENRSKVEAGERGTQRGETGVIALVRFHPVLDVLSFGLGRNLLRRPGTQGLGLALTDGERNAFAFPVE